MCQIGVAVYNYHLTRLERLAHDTITLGILSFYIHIVPCGSTITNGKYYRLVRTEYHGTFRNYHTLLHTLIDPYFYIHTVEKVLGRIPQAGGYLYHTTIVYGGIDLL